MHPILHGLGSLCPLPLMFFFLGGGKGIHLQGMGQLGPSPGCSPPQPYLYPGSLQGLELTRSSPLDLLFACLPSSPTPITFRIHSFSVCLPKVMGESVNSLVRYLCRDLTGHCSPLFFPKNMTMMVVGVRDMSPATPSVSIVTMHALHTKKRTLCTSSLPSTQPLEADNHTAFKFWNLQKGENVGPKAV